MTVPSVLMHAGITLHPGDGVWDCRVAGWAPLGAGGCVLSWTCKSLPDHTYPVAWVLSAGREHWRVQKNPSVVLGSPLGMTRGLDVANACLIKERGNFFASKRTELKGSPRRMEASVRL